MQFIKKETYQEKFKTCCLFSWIRSSWCQSRFIVGGRLCGATRRARAYRSICATGRWLWSQWHPCSPEASEGGKLAWGLMLNVCVNHNVIVVYSPCSGTWTRLQEGSCPATRSCSWEGSPRPRRRGSYMSRWSLCPTLWRDKRQLGISGDNCQKNNHDWRLYCLFFSYLYSISKMSFN